MPPQFCNEGKPDSWFRLLLDLENRRNLWAGNRFENSIANVPERGVYAASSFGTPQGKRFVYARSGTEAA